jgi:hypothetical protein
VASDATHYRLDNASDKRKEMIETFTASEFEQVLTDAQIRFDDLGWMQGERVYHIALDSKSGIRIRSSIKLDGQSAEAGKDSIRAYLVADGKPLASKKVTGQERWVTRVPGWETRLIATIEKLRFFRQQLGNCRSCGAPNQALVSHTSKNPGRHFTKCSRCGQWGAWLNIDNVERQESLLFTGAGKPTSGFSGNEQTKSNSKTEKGDLFAPLSSKVESKGIGLEELRSVGLNFVVPFSNNENKESQINNTGLSFLSDATPIEMPSESAASEPVITKPFTPSLYQEAIRDFVLNSDRALRVEAYAGSGKTSTNAFVCRALDPSRGKVKMMVFSKANQLDMEKKIPDWIPATTTHSAGFSDIRHVYKNVKVDERKTYNLCKSEFQNDRDMWDNYPAISKLLSLCKNTLSEPTNENLDQLCEQYDIPVNGNRDNIFDAVGILLQKSLEQMNVIDFDDMLWMPASGKVPVEKCDLLFVDECLPFFTPVLLSDGLSVEIGAIKVGMEVLSYNAETKQQEKCKVTGFHEILNQKPLVKIRAKWHGRKGTNTPYNFIVCTIDHKIWCNEKWIEAGQINIGDTLQVETSASKSQTYKITTKGRKSLSSVMGKKNKQGMKRKNNRGFISKQGGNGKPLSVPQQTLLNALGKGWIAEYPVPIKMARDSGYPTCYKIDIANPSLQVAIEIDGQGHRLEINKQRDEKKEKLLQSLGWMTLRYQNWQAVQHTQELVDSIYHQINDCPIDATVVSIEPTNIPDYFVYDISVEKCHNFYANGILVHNCQDSNLAQESYYIKTGARIIFVGDEHQSIFGFRGAQIGEMNRMQEKLKASQLPLPISYRCAKSIIQLAQTIVPQIQAREDAPEGIVGDCSGLSKVQPGDMVLCRNNAPLVRPCFDLIRNGIKATIKGRDIGTNLINLIRKVEKKNPFVSQEFIGLLSKVQDYVDEQSAKLNAQHKESQAASLQDQGETIVALSESCHSLDDLERRVKTIFSDDVQGVMFSTIHKAKGLESDRVFVLKPELLSPQKYDTRGWQLEQLSNLTYVCYTRAKNELRFVR